jgi:hypothetical protein
MASGGGDILPRNYSRTIKTMAANAPKSRASKKKKKLGRPSKRTPKVVKAICEGLAEGQSLREMCKKPELPSWRRVLTWAHEDPIFRQQYEEAQRARLETWAEQLVTLADQPDKNVQQRRLQIDTRKWILSKLLPKKYGDRLALAGDDESPLHLSDIEVEHRIRSILADAEKRRAEATAENGDKPVEGNGAPSRLTDPRLSDS